MHRFLIYSLALLLTAHAAAQDDPRETELAAIRQEISQLEKKLSRMRGRESTLEGQVGQLKLEIELQEIQLQEATAAFELASARATAAEAEIARLETALVQIQDDLRRRLAGLYRLGGRGYLRLFLSLEPDADMLPAIRQLRFLVRRDRDTLERYTATRDTLQSQQHLLAEQQREAELWRGREQERQDALVATRRRQERLLERVTAERRRLADRTRRLEDKARKLASLIDSLTTGRLTPLDGPSIQSFRGALDWPVGGEVTSRFGPRLDPRYRTEVPHNGIDIGSTEGAQVRAIFPGEVLYSSIFEGYGPMAVVHHPGRVFTLYAGLGELRVAKGDVLSLGQVIGTATEVLYFEIRVENQPQNPVEWLR